MMLMITVEYFGQICALVQTRGETIELPDPADLGELLDAVACLHGLPPRPVAPPLPSATLAW